MQVVHGISVDRLTLRAITTARIHVTYSGSQAEYAATRAHLFSNDFLHSDAGNLSDSCVSAKQGPHSKPVLSHVQAPRCVSRVIPHSAERLRDPLCCVMTTFTTAQRGAAPPVHAWAVAPLSMHHRAFGIAARLMSSSRTFRTPGPASAERPIPTARAGCSSTHVRANLRPQDSLKKLPVLWFNALLGCEAACLLRADKPAHGGAGSPETRPDPRDSSVGCRNCRQSGSRMFAGVHAVGVAPTEPDVISNTGRSLTSIRLAEL